MDGQADYPNWLKAFPPEPAPDARGPRRAPKRKKKPGKRPAKNRNVGKLAGIVKMPLDVFYEIASYMHPSDLLRISRVSRHFRSMLMTANAAGFWRVARKNIGMPDPPPDLNDAQYVALIFEHVCNACGAKVEWCKILSLKVQLCKKCNWHNIEGTDRITRLLGPSIKDFDWSLVLLVEDLLVRDWENVAAYMASRSLSAEKIAYGPQVKAVVKRLSTLEGEAREAYVKQQRRMVQDTLNFIRRYNAWEMKRQAEHFLEEARRNKIIQARLEALGHDRQDMRWHDDTDWGKLFTEGGEINEMYWRKTSLPSLEREIAIWKGSRMVDELCRRLTHRYTEFMVLLTDFLPEYSDLNPVHPPGAHWKESEALFDLLRLDEGRTPVTCVFLEEHRGVILDVITEFNYNLRADIIQMAFADPLGPTKPIAISEEKAFEIFNRSSTLFVKKDRTTGVRTSTLYSYDGLIKDIRKNFRWEELDVRLRYDGYDPYGWSGALLEILGLDEDVTWDVVDAEQERMPLVCLCGKPGFKQPASFIELLSHVLEESDWQMENLRPSEPLFDHEHNTVDLSRLKETIVQLDPENGPPLDVILGEHRQRLIERAKGNGVPIFLSLHGWGYKCLDCDSYNAETMTRKRFEWHALTKHSKYTEDLDDLDHPHASCSCYSQINPYY